MAENDLKEKAITVQGGKQYVLVSDRVIHFNAHYPNGAIQTVLLTPPDSDKIAFKAVVTPDMHNSDRFFIGHSQAVVGAGMVNKTAAMENAETSAIGRALGMMGIGVIDSIASHDELAKAQALPPVAQQTEPDFSYEKTDEMKEEGVPTHFCELHSKELKERTSSNGGKYYDHRRKNEVGIWEKCNGTGWKI